MLFTRVPNRSIFALTAIVALLAACSSAPSAKSAARARTPGPAQANNPAHAVSVPAQPSSAPVGGSSAGARPSAGSLTAKLSEISGQVLARVAPNASFADPTVGTVVQVLGQVQTQTNGKVRMDFSTGTLMRLGPNTLFTLQPPQDNSQGLIVRLQMSLGQLWIILRGGGPMQVQTKSGVAAVLGSLMSVSFNNVTGDLRITCLEGHCSLTNPAGTVNITTGQTAEVTNASLPPQVGLMTSADFQAWLTNNPESQPYVVAAGGSTTGTETTTTTTTNHGKGHGRGGGHGGGQGSGQGGGH